MSTVQAKPKFVSSIPNNKLEPVFIGRPEKDSVEESSPDKKKGVYVPAFLKNKQDDRNSIQENPVKKPVQKKPQMTNADFPELTSSKPKTTPAQPLGRVSFLEMLKKPKPEPEKPEVVEQQVAQKGMLVMGRGVPKQNKPTVSSWADDEEEPDYSEPFYPDHKNTCDYYEEDEEEDVEDDDTYYKLRR